MEKVFMPLNRQMVDVIVKNGDLLEGDMPPDFLKLVSHASGYEALLEKWNSGDFSEHVPLVVFPRNIEVHVKETYINLKARQSSLLGKRWSVPD